MYVHGCDQAHNVGETRLCYYRPENTFSLMLRRHRITYELIKKSLAEFPLAHFFLDEVQPGAVESVEDMFPIDSRCIDFEYITLPPLHM